ncbi:MAG: AIR synthase-related protein, partial [Patescibacteria group bacterium]
QLREIVWFYEDQGRTTARDAELEMIAAAWSDHCNHSTWKAMGLLRLLRMTTEDMDHPLVISAFVDNSGVMKFYGGYALCIKGETHISPTFGGAPYGGIMTKHGGVIRDIIFTAQGAWPFAGTTVMATVDPHISWDEVPAGAFHPETVVREAIRGTHDYTNPMGIPMAWSEYLEDGRNWKGYALGHSVGVLPEARAQKGTPQSGDIVLYVGEKTGNDGLHGATVSSAKMTSDTATVDAAHVQIGMPIGERVFMEAIPMLRDADCIRACTDCGAAGLASAVGEMGNPNGVSIDLAKVPLKCATTLPWQILLSESQERGVLAVPPEKLPEAMRILTDYNVPFAVLGVFTETKSFVAMHGETVVVDLPYSYLGSDGPLPKIAVADHPEERHYQQVLQQLPTAPEAWMQMLAAHLTRYNICDQSAAAHRYDQTVQGNTVLPYIGGDRQNMPDELAVYTPVPGQRWGAGLAVATSQRYADHDPYVCGKLLMAQAMTRLVAAGFSPDDITCNVNVYTPRVTDSPENARRLCDLVSGYAVASRELHMPVISGKDSSSGTFMTKDNRRIDAPLTLTVAALGRMPDASRVIRKPFAQAGDRIILFRPGLVQTGLGGSEYLAAHPGYDVLPHLDLVALHMGLVAYHAFTSHKDGRVHSRSVVAQGGLIRRLFEMALGSGGLGCRIHLSDENPAHLLFAEWNGAIVFATDDDSWRQFLKEGSQAIEIGIVTDEPTIRVRQRGADHDLFNAPLARLADGWSTTFTEVVQ